MKDFNSGPILCGPVPLTGVLGDYERYCLCTKGHDGDHVFTISKEAAEGPEDIVVGPNGGKGSRVHARYDLVPPIGLKMDALRMAKGVKYGEWNWLKCPSEEHLQHLLNHINEYRIGGDGDEGHVSGIVARALMFAEALVREGKIPGP